MSKKSKMRAALGGLLTFALVLTCAAIYQSGSKSTPNEKEFVKENEENIVDQAIKTEEREDTEETQDVSNDEIDSTREIVTTEENADTTEEASADPAAEEEASTETSEETAAPVESAPSEETSTEIAAELAPDINFTESSLMEWPVNGQVVLDYNMENTIYFPTLNVYKLNPSVSISAEVGAPVAAVANGQVLSITENEETGTTVTVDMGNGYQAIYGQLKDVAFQANDYVSAGSVLGYINEPTKYYTKEGSNLYFALEKDGTPLDPLQYLP